MIVTTSATIDGKPIQEYLGVAAGEAIMGANALKDFSSGIRDLVGGRSASYEQVINKAREIAMNDLVERARALGANAIVGVDVDYETIDRGKKSNSSMLMVSVSGTAVRIAD
ncbi:MAG: heavy metal-binding domain-containing protein [Chloroflexi bacterium]|jgi:uncharacterized protein YbjQ (UPF0145 family)|nr:heavy metal-binding domain-containing protein [Chloroflexota bacterium]